MADDVTPVRAGSGWFGELARVVVPVQCAGCGAFDVVLCAACRAILRRSVSRCEADAPRLDRLDGRPPPPVWARAAYDGPVREVILAWKDRGRADLTAALRDDFGDAVVGLAPALAIAIARDAALACDAALARDDALARDGALRDLAPQRPSVGGAGPVRPALLVVGAPSSRGAVRRRGADLVAGLAETAAVALSAGGVRARALAALEQRRGVRDQAGLGARARGRNLSGRIRVRDGTDLRGRIVVVVDDVLTTGATLAGAVRALERAGARVVAGFVLAATPGPGGANRDNADDGPTSIRSRRAVEGPMAGEVREQPIA